MECMLGEAQQEVQTSVQQEGFKKKKKKQEEF